MRRASFGLSGLQYSREYLLHTSASPLIFGAIVRNAHRRNACMTIQDTECISLKNSRQSRRNSSTIIQRSSLENQCINLKM